MWMMRGLPSAQGHHRWIPGNEFAVDLFRVGPDGTAANGDELIAENNFGYGASVSAAADGVVAYVIADQTQDRRAQWILPGETMSEARDRISLMNMNKMMEDFRGSQAGNLVTIRHDGPDGSIEYSSYAHLKAGSVRVKVGQRVSSGEVIGEVGDTGDSSAVHLHFQVNEGPDAFFYASRPFRFYNLVEAYEGQDPGLFVRGGL
jgi:murein DD-endopeptidase MepM/ murein hydrolase activator NlpD